MYKHLIKPIFFRFDPEVVHHWVFRTLKRFFRIPLSKSIFRFIYSVKDRTLEREVFGLKFSNPVGLAAGFDKDAKLYEELGCFGFSHIEIGTLTPKPQDGNDRPRMFRLPENEALINRMGFNNEGVLAAVERLKNRNPSLIIGGNIGKNKLTPNEDAVNDYLLCLHALHEYVDYFVVNVSSPNTPGLRALQDKEPLSRILYELKLVNARKEKPKPILLKIAPDLEDTQLDDIIEIVRNTGIDGIIATNTTLDRSSLINQNTEKQIGQGGLSGKPLEKRSTEVIRYLHSKSGGAFPIIGVGGIYDAKGAKEKLDAGASLVQVYTGFIYEGPGIVKRINKGLLGK